jgi:hypothetical protein
LDWINFPHGQPIDPRLRSTAGVDQALDDGTNRRRPTVAVDLDLVTTVLAHDHFFTLWSTPPAQDSNASEPFSPAPLPHGLESVRNQIGGLGPVNQYGGNGTTTGRGEDHNAGQCVGIHGRFDAWVNAMPPRTMFST